MVFMGFFLTVLMLVGIAWRIVTPNQVHYQQKRHRHTRQNQAQTWTLALLQSLEWHRFEELCAAYFQIIGFQSTLTQHGADEGIDIELRANDNPQALLLVQCKAWTSTRVGVKTVRELLGVMVHSQAQHGILTTTGRFTSAAQQFAHNQALDLLDGERLLAEFQQLPKHLQQDLLQIATQGDYQTPSCPSCGQKMQAMPLLISQQGKAKRWQCLPCQRQLKTARSA